MNDQPVSPSEVRELCGANIPKPVFEVFNKLIVLNFLGGSSTFYEGDAVTILMNEGRISRKEYFEINWSHVRVAYEAKGWIVEYDPSHPKPHLAKYTFKIPK